MKISGEFLFHSLPYDLRMCLSDFRACLSLPYPRLGKQALVSAPSPPVLALQAQAATRASSVDAENLNLGAHPHSKPSFPQAEVLFACFCCCCLLFLFWFFQKGSHVTHAGIKFFK